MTRCAFLTLADRTDFVIDDSLAIDEVTARGWEVDEIPWTAEVAWSRFDLVVIRTPWDYQSAPSRFLEVLAEIDARTLLVNPLPIVRWNLDKHYLGELSGKGIPTVPTKFTSGFGLEQFAEAQSTLRSEELIVKPCISANAQDTYRIRSHQQAEELATRFDGRDVMVQPFVETILEHGEESLFYFDGRYSHAIRKVPATGDFRVQEEHGGEIIPLEPDPDSLELSEQILRSIPERLTYARVDLVRSPDGDPLLIELELIEPSLYFRMDAGAPARFADALEAVASRLG